MKKVERPKRYGVRIVLPLTVEMLKALDRSLAPKQTRVDFIRIAITRRLLVK